MGTYLETPDGRQYFPNNSNTHSFTPEGGVVRARENWGPGGVGFEKMQEAMVKLPGMATAIGNQLMSGDAEYNVENFMNVGEGSLFMNAESLRFIRENSDADDPNRGKRKYLEWLAQNITVRPTQEGELMVGVKASDPYSAQGGFSPLLKVTGPNMSNAAITTTFNELALLSYGGVTPPGPVLRERGLKPEKPESQVEQLFEEAMILRNNGREKAGYKTDESRQELMDRLGEQNPMRGFMWGLFKDSGDYYKESTEHVKEALNYAKNFNPDVDTSMFKVMTSDERNKEKDFQKVREMVSSYKTVSFNNNHIAPHIGALPNGVQVLEKRGFMVAYDKDNKRNMFVGYVISPETDSAARDDFDFKADPAVKEEYRGTAFKNSGQDQGHFIAAAIAGALGGDEGAADSYLSTNIGAQRSEFNRMGGAYYTQEFEYQERAKKEKQSYYVLKGALPSDRRIGSGPDNTVENPDKFWSIYMKKGADGWEIDGFVLDEDTIRYENAEHHVQKLEEMSEILGVDLSQVINDVSEVR